MATTAENKRQYEQQKAFFLSLLGDVCKVCGSRHNLEVDHIDPATKSFTISARRWSKITISIALEELKKCQALCEDCHKKKTAHEAAAKPKCFRHGTMYGWMKIKCDCKSCSTAKWAWHDTRNASRRQRAAPNKMSRSRLLAT